MKIFWKTVIYTTTMSVFGVNAMEPNWDDIISKTKSKTVSSEERVCSEEAVKIFSWERCQIDWNKVTESANNGSPIAQYALAGHLFKLSGELFNGERIKMRSQAYMYAVISAIIGEFEIAKSEYIEPNNLGKLSRVTDFLEAAKHMAMNEDF